MTNFEHWKQELTVERLSKILLEDATCTILCPLIEECSQPHTACMLGEFEAWANAPYEPQEVQP